MPTLGVFTQATSPDESKTPFGNILAGIMRSNAMVQGQQQAKKVAQDQMSAPQPVVTMEANPSGGPPLITIKKIPADQLNGTQAKDVQAAHDTPQQNVEKKIGEMGIGGNPGAYEGAALRSVGYPPQETNATAEGLRSSYGAEFRAQRDMGESIPSALVKGAAAKVGLFSNARLAEDLNRTHAMQNAAAFKAAAEPVIQTESAGIGHSLQANQQYLSVRNQLLDQANTIDPTTDVSSYLNQVVGPAMNAVGGLRPGDEALFNAAIKNRRVSFLKDRLAEANTPEGRTVAAQYPQTDEGFRQWTRESVGVPPENLSEFEKNKLHRNFNALQDQHVTDAIGTARKEGVLGTFESVDDAKQAYGLQNASGKADAEFTATYAAARRAYKLADTRTQRSLAIQAQQLAALQQKNAPPPEVKPQTPQFKVAQDLAYGKLSISDFRALYSYSRDVNTKLAIYNKASELNPNFDPQAFELGRKVAANPKIRQQVAAQDNAISLIPDMIEASDQATRMGPTAFNKFINKGGIAIGGKKYTDAATMRTVFADEVSGALGFGSATDMTRELGLKMADLDLSSENFRSAMEKVHTALVKKRASLVNQMGVYGKDVNNMSAGGQGGGNVISLDEALKTIRKKP